MKMRQDAQWIFAFWLTRMKCSATLNGMSERQNQKKQADGAGESGNSIDSTNAADSSGGICRLITMRVI